MKAGESRAAGTNRRWDVSLPKAMSKKNSQAKTPSAAKAKTDEPKQTQVQQAPEGAPDAPSASAPTQIEQLVLDFAREPDKHAKLTDPHAALPKDLSKALERAAEAMSVMSQAVAARSAEAASADQARIESEFANATLVFVKRVLLAPGADHYRVLGLDSAATTEDVHRHYRWLRRIFWQEETDPSGQSAVIRISEAYVALREPQSRRMYNERIGGRRSNVFIGDHKTERVFSPPVPVSASARRAKAPAERRGRSGLLGPAVVVLALAGALGYWLRQTDVSEPPEIISEQVASPTEQIVAAPEEPPELAPVELPTPPAVEPVPVAPAEISAADDELLARVDKFVEDEAPPSIDAPAVVEEPVLASVPEVSLEPTVAEPTPEEIRAQEVAALLGRARQQIEDSLLTQPEGNNAFESFQQVLALDPLNVEAQQGLRDIADRYVGLARYRLQRERHAEALEMADKGLAVVPDHDQLLVLKALAEEGLAAQQAPKAEPQLSPPLLTVPSTASAPAAAVADEGGGVADIAGTPDNLTSVAEPSSLTGDGLEAESEPMAGGGIAVIPVRPEPAAVVPAPTNVETPPAVVSSVAPPASPTKPAEEEGGLTDRVLNKLVDEFVNRYETGELDPFMNLFAEDARTNNRVSKAGVRDDYAALFETTQSRLMRLRDVRWSRDKETAIGEGDFSLNILKKGERRPRSFEGSLTFQVYLVDGKPKIRGLYHAQRKVAR